MSSRPPIPGTADPTAYLPVMVQWPGDDGQTYSIGTTESRSVIFVIDTSLPQVRLELRLSLELRKPLGKTKLHLYIAPDKVRSASLDYNIVLPDAAITLHETACLRLELDCPADLVAPGWPLRPVNKAHTNVLDLVQALARQTAMNIYFPTHVSDGPIERLCQIRSCHELAPAPLDLGSLYMGHGGVRVDVQQLAPQASYPLPPSYDEVEAGPSGKITPSKLLTDSNL